MKTYIYILTDSKRSNLHIGYTDDLASIVNFYKEKRAMFFNSDSIATRLVYTEEFYSEEKAIVRLDQMRMYTRQQKEQLIRSFNPNWSELPLDLTLSYHPGAKFKPKVPNLTSFL